MKHIVQTTTSGSGTPSVTHECEFESIVVAAQYALECRAGYEKYHKSNPNSWYRIKIDGINLDKLI